MGYHRRGQRTNTSRKDKYPNASQDTFSHLLNVKAHFYCPIYNRVSALSQPLEGSASLFICLQSSEQISRKKKMIKLTVLILQTKTQPPWWR